MTRCIVNRNLKKVALLPWNGDTQRLYVTIYGDEVITYNTGKVPCAEQSQSNKIDHAYEITDNQSSEGARREI